MKREVICVNELDNKLYFRVRKNGGIVWGRYIVEQPRGRYFYVYLFDNIYRMWFKLPRRFETLDEVLIEFGFKEAYETFKKGGYTNK